MFKLRSIYLYLVCFVTLMMILFGTIFTVQNVMDLVFPTDYYSYQMPSKEGEMTDQEIKMYEKNQQMDRENRAKENKKDVGKSVAVVLIAVPTFIYHWRKIETERKEAV